MTAWDGLLWDARLVADGADPVRVATEHGELRAERGDALGPLLVPDTALARLDRAVGDLGVGPVPVAVISSTGAGGVLAVAGRECSDLSVVAVHSTLRDLDDLAGNAARVVAAARALPDGVEVTVGLPTAPGWQRAAETVEAAGLVAAVGDDHDQWAELVELDLPFVVTDDRGGVEAIIRTVHGLIEADPATSAPLDPDRVRRRLRGIWTNAPGTLIR